MFVARRRSLPLNKRQPSQRSARKSRSSRNRTPSSPRRARPRRRNDGPSWRGSSPICKRRRRSALPSGRSSRSRCEVLKDSVVHVGQFGPLISTFFDWESFAVSTHVVHRNFPELVGAYDVFTFISSGTLFVSMRLHSNFFECFHCCEAIHHCRPVQ